MFRHFTLGTTAEFAYTLVIMDNSAESHIEIQKNMGNRIRNHRLALNMTLLDLSNATGLTNSTISQIERALMSPSISTLKKICDALQIPIGELFIDRDENEGENIAPPDVLEDPQAAPVNMDKTVLSHQVSPVVRKERRKFLSPCPGVRYHLLTPNLSGPLEVIYNEYDPGTSTGPTFYTHPGVESGVVLSGQLEVQINTEVYTLNEGDSITFNSSDPHLLRNNADEMCICIWVNTPPWF
jgi:transcriptional regulator with XRE-family HTH domain